MPYAIRYREELPEPVQRELDDMIAYFNHQLDIALAPDGTIKPSALVPPAGTDITDESHWWRKGPWSFDDPDALDPNIAAILTPDIPGVANVNDFAPKGIDSCIILQVSPITGTVTLTGIKSPNPRRRRIMLLYNVSTTQDLILANASALSQPTNRFNLPNGDVTVAPGQTVWLYWSIAGWNAAITAQKSGGLFGEGSTVFPSTVTTFPNTVTNTLFTSVLRYSTAQILNASAVRNIVSAPGAGKIVIPVFMASAGSKTTGSTSAQPSFFCSFAGDGTNRYGTMSQLWTTAAGAVTISHNKQVCTSGAFANNVDPTNKAITLQSAADITTANGFDGILTIYLSYYILTI